MSPTEALALARRAFDAAAPHLERPLAGKPPVPHEVAEKAAHDYFTELDVAIERSVAEVLGTEALHGEEIFHAPTDAPEVWYLDPIDGTRNLLSGRAGVALSLARYVEGQPQVALIRLPCRDLELAATTDQEGLFVNGAPWSPPPAPPPERALAGMPGDIRDPSDVALFGGMFHRLGERFEGIRIAGALAYDLACMALGELDVRISMHAKPVDVAAGAYLLEKAGGCITDLEGRPFTPASPGVLAARSPELHAALLALFA